MDNIQQKHIVVVLGMHRSGTSAITRSLKVIGVELGSYLIGGIPGDNEKGFFEDIDVNTFNNELLHALSHDWHTLTPIFPEELEAPVAVDFKLRAVEILRKKLSTTNCLGLKDPRFARLLPFWQSVFKHLRVRVSYVIACRNPMSVARSLAKRDGFDLVKSYYLWLEHMLQSLIQTTNQSRIVVDYDRLMKDPAIQLERMAQSLGLSFDPEGPEFDEYRSLFLENSLRHTRFLPEDLDLDTSVLPSVAELYKTLLELASDTVQSDHCEVVSLVSRASEKWRENYPALHYMRVCEEKASTLVQKLSERDGQIAGLNQEIVGRDVQIAGLNQAVAESSVQIADLNQEIVGRDVQITGLSQAVSESGVQIAGLNQAVAESSVQITGLNQEIVGRDVQIAGLNQAVAKRDGQITGLEAATKEKDANIENLKGLVKEKESEIGGLRSGLAEKEGVIVNLNEAASQKDAHISHLEGVVGEKAAEAEGLKTGLAKKEGVIVNLNEAVSQKDAHISHLEGVVGEKAAEAEGLKTGLAKKEGVIINLNEAAAQKDAHISHLEGVVVEKAAEAEGLKTGLAKKEGVIINLNETVSQKDSKISELSGILSEKDEVIAEVNVSLRQRDARISNLGAVVREREAAIDNLRANLTERDAGLNHIYNSHGWKALLVYYRLRDKIFPINTKKRLFAALVFRTIINPKKILRNLNKTNLKKFIYYFRTSAPEVLEEMIRRKISNDTGAMEREECRPYQEITSDNYEKNELVSAENETSPSASKSRIATNPLPSAPKQEVKAVRNSIFFNEEYYRNTNADLAASNMDMARHYCEHGWREGRNPSALFDTLYYLGANSDIRNAKLNPLYHYIIAGKKEGRSPAPSHNSDYEDDCRFGDIVTDIKPIAFYLPQFHEIPENNKWWGEGFTEWTNTRKAKPLLEGHYQPRESHEDIGYYDLSDWRVLKNQADMAKAHGIYGFCFYHYWFSGKRLLDKPVDMFLDHPEIDFPFCLCWANENWTRRWDGLDSEILIEQQYSAADDIAFIDNLEKYLQDKRYIRIDGKPVILLYRPGLLPKAKETAERWRKRLRQKGIGEVYLICAHGVFADTTSPHDYGFDAAYEFAPNIHMPHQTYFKVVSSNSFKGNLCNYGQFAEDVLHNRELHKNKDFALYYSVMLEWDNTARRGQIGSTIFSYYNSLSYRKWLDKTIEITRLRHKKDRRFIFINSWNEWAEGTYLEPDRRYGYLSLNETSRALCNIKPGRKLPRVSVIVPNYNHARFLRRRLNSIYNQTYKNIEVILMDDCSSDSSREILDEYAALYPNITRRAYNDKNSGGVFHQWAAGIKLATGDLVWIAESDDFCDENFLDILVQSFEDEAVLLAYSHCVFVDENEKSLEQGGFEYYVGEIDSQKWRSSYVETAHNEVRKALGIINTIPNSSGVVFRRPKDLNLLDNEEWLSMSVAGDWVFYLHVIHGGKIAYDTRTSNYFRRYEGSAAQLTYKREVYYRELGMAARTIASLYDVPMDILERSRNCYLGFFNSVVGDNPDKFYEWYDFEAVLEAKRKRRPAVMVSVFAFYPGGAEIIAIRLANELKRQGLPVLFHGGKVRPRENRIRRMLRNDIPVLETDRTDEMRDAIREFGIEVLNSHHWHIQRYPLFDPTVFADLPRHVATLHGMIEAKGGYGVTSEQLRLVDKYVATWVYTADKNIEPFQSAGLYDDNPNRFVKIPNGMEPPSFNPIPREELNIPQDAFVLCNVSRAIPEKGWVETIEVVKKARELTGKDIRLILVGNGPVYDEYSKKGIPGFVYMPGFDKRSVEYYATADMGIMLTRFQSESFPLTITDCLFAGKPYIASAIGEIRNMLTTEEGVAGAVFELDDWKIPVDDVARIVADFATESSKYEEAKARVPQAAKRYKIKNVARQYLGVFDTLSGIPSPQKTCLMYGDDQWFDIMKRSVNEPMIDGIPMPGFPDADLQIATVGSSFEASLKEADAFTRQVKRFMSEYGTGLTHHSKILDFGTGWGRMYRFFLNSVLAENILGTDVDQNYIDVCRRTIPWGRFEKNNIFPPMEYENNSFDAVVAYSVFSHLNKDVGLSWIEEFSRIIRPGGILAITTHSRDFIDFCDGLRKNGRKLTSEWHIRLAEKAFLDKKQAYRDYDLGRFMYVPGVAHPVRNTDVYGDAILSPKYVKMEWTKYLDLIDFIDDKAILPQAMLVMQKPINNTCKKISLYETDFYREYENTEESYLKGKVGFCSICEEKSTFVSDHKWLRDNYRCVKCRSIPRQRYVQHIFHSLVPGWKNMYIHESSPCNDFIKRCVTGYTASQFYPGKEPGERVGEFTNENLEALTFDNNTFDLFLTQDVLEHVFNPERAAKEMLRVVKPGGYVIFTIPVFHGHKTLQRARIDENGDVEYLENAVYHGNPVDSNGSLAVWDYGDDFIDNLKKWATDNEVEVFNHSIPELGIEGEFLDLFYIKK